MVLDADIVLDAYEIFNKVTHQVMSFLYDEYLYFCHVTSKLFQAGKYQEAALYAATSPKVGRYREPTHLPSKIYIELHPVLVMLSAFSILLGMMFNMLLRFFTFQ